MNLFMDQAYKLALKAYNKNEVPVGCVIVENGKIIAKAYNKKESSNVTNHAELIAIRKASKKKKTWRLNNCSIYVTLEPCPMCLYAIILSRIDTIYYGVKTTKLEDFNMLDFKGFNHYPKKVFLKDNNSKKLIKKFFKEKRIENKNYSN